MTSKLFSSESLYLHRKRAQKSFSTHAFLYTHVKQELQERVEDLGHPLSTVFELSEETALPLSSPVGAVLSCLQAHWVNDLPTFLRQIRESLGPKGLFLGALWGGETLHELRESLLQAELSLKGGASPRVAPMVQPKDAPQLLGRAGFVNPVVDVELLTVTYPSLQGLMHDLRGMGENNSLQDRLKTFTSRALFAKAEEIYRRSFGFSGDRIPATFEVIYLTGWGQA